MGPLAVVIKPPGFNEFLRAFEVEKPMLVEALVTHCPVEALEESVLDGFSGLVERERQAERHL